MKFIYAVEAFVLIALAVILACISLPFIFLAVFAVNLAELAQSMVNEIKAMK